MYQTLEKPKPYNAVFGKLDPFGEIFGKIHHDRKHKNNTVEHSKSEETKRISPLEKR